MRGFPAETAPPLDAADFARLIAALGPFEARPRLAVAVSGGADSLALTLLAQDWARARGGRVEALTVDHGLRPEAAAEARRVGGWLRRHGIAHRVLRWTGAKPRTGLPAAARAARYALLVERCRADGVLHLLLGHNLEDQAETVLLRLGRGSGLYGLAGMAPVAETEAVRLLRPLLAVPRARLRATLERRGQPWIEDPTNRDPAYARARVRAVLPELGREGMTPRRLAETAARLGRARAALEAETADLLAGAATVHPAGFVTLRREALRAAPEEVSLRALAAVLMCVGGSPYAPRMERLGRLHAELIAGAGGRARTLGGCRLLPATRRLLVCREPAAAAGPVAARPDARVVWDGRFAVRFGGRRGRARLGALGAAGWRQVAAARPELRDSPVPPPVRPSLPALFDAHGVLAVPHLAYRRARGPAGSLAVSIGSVLFRPPAPLAGPRYAADLSGCLGDATHYL